MSIMDEAFVNYDILQQRISKIINDGFQVQYLLFTLKTRAEASGFDGFACFFDKEMRFWKLYTDDFTKSLIDEEHGVNFPDIKGISLRGNKLIDLLNLYRQALLKNLESAKQVSQELEKRIEYRICVGGFLNTYLQSLQYSINVVNKYVKKLGRAINDYNLVLLTDEKIGGEYGNQNKGC